MLAELLYDEILLSLNFCVYTASASALTSAVCCCGTVGEETS